MVKKVRRAIKNKYAFGVYKPNKNCKPVTYNGTEYLSKAQCMALEGITRKELDEYLNGDLGEINEAINEAGDAQEEHPAEGPEEPLEEPLGPDEIPPLGPGDIHDVMDFNGLL
mgnify:FL=1